MRIFTKIETYLRSGPVVLSIGNFDGLHLGHQYLLQQNLNEATRNKARSAVLSFSPHPMEVLHAEDFCTLSTMEEQEKGLEQIGIDDWLIEPFSEATREEEPEAFIARLMESLPLLTILVGPDFRFGKNRRGEVKLLQELTFSKGIRVLIPEPYTMQGTRVSSTQIRFLLKQGDLERANELLGRPYSLQGKVLAGFKRGQKMGFPTANIRCKGAANLKPGVYSTHVFVRGNKFKGATNVGFHPTFDDDTELKVETHILDFCENLYGEWVRLEFMQFIRPELKFSDMASLKNQIAKDLQVVRST